MLVRMRASAGSGKTYELTRRMTGLVLQAAGLSSPLACREGQSCAYGLSDVLAVTFTNKAASEMRERVIKELKLLALLELADNPEGGPACKLIGGILRHSQKLNIRTIDSLLNQFTRAYALELEVSPDYSTVFELREIFDGLFERLASKLDDPARSGDLAGLVLEAAQRLMRIEDVKGFRLAKPLRDKLFAVFELCLADENSRPLADEEIKAALDELTQRLKQAVLKLKNGLAAAAIKGNANFIKFIDRCEMIDPFSEIKESAFASKDTLGACLLKGDLPKLNSTLERLYAEFKQAYAGAEMLPLLRGALTLTPFYGLSLELLNDFESYGREHSLMASARWPGMVKRMLQMGAQPEGAYCRLGSRLAHLLIDEFQDTSREQWEVLEILAREALSKGGGVFYVGDVKQAIYGWRGGDSALFEQACGPRSLGAIAQAQDKSLDFNWRSAPAVVEFNNLLFSGLADSDLAADCARLVLGSKAGQEEIEGLAARLAGAYAECAQKLPVREPEVPGYVELKRFSCEKKEEALEQLKLWVLDLFGSDLANRVRLGDIAVLTRNNFEAGLVSAWLVELGLPVLTENSLRLASHPLVAELIGLLGFLDYPPDDASFWRFISGKIFSGLSGLAYSRLADWLVCREPGPLYSVFAQDFPEPYTRFIEPFLGNPGLAGPYDILREALGAYKVIERFKEHEIFLRRLLEVVYSLERSGTLTLAGFLDYWREQGLMEKAPQAEGLNAVRVMTGHKAKGLQFKVVVAPFFGFIQPKKLSKPLFAEIGGRRLLLPAKRALGQTYFKLLADTWFEEFNLCYVTATRAEHELYLGLPRTKTANGLPQALDALLAGVESEPGAEMSCFGVKPLAGEWAENVVSPDKPLLEPVQALAPLENIEPPLSWLPRLRVYRSPLSDLNARSEERERGVFMHAAAELLAKGFAPEQAARRAGLAVLEETRRERWVKECVLALNWLLGHPELALALSQGAAELELLSGKGAVLRPDLVHFGPNGPLVVDYKTGGQSPEHLSQMRRYLNLISRLPQASGQTAQGIVAYLDERVLHRVEAS